MAEFGVVGYSYGEIRPTAITFFIDGTTKVSDHRGNRIKDYDGSHQQTIEKLKDAGHDWQKLVWAGFPQLPYEQLAELSQLPPTPIDELAKIKDTSLRKDALRIRREADEAAAKELELADVE